MILAQWMYQGMWILAIVTTVHGNIVTKPLHLYEGPEQCLTIKSVLEKEFPKNKYTCQHAVVGFSKGVSDGYNQH